MKDSRPRRLVAAIAAVVFVSAASSGAGSRAARPNAPRAAHAHEAEASCAATASAAPRPAATSAAAITWVPVEITCPLCGTKNTFLRWGSYGSYIYQSPSKYQLVFWPFTDSPVLYSCKQCRLTAFMDDFEKTPKEKFGELRKALEGVSLPRKESYTQIPMSERLVVAEKVYRALGQADDEFWNHFHRVQGYHFAAEGRAKEADEARRRALEITERQLADKAREPLRKELLYISGAMRHFLRDDAGALKDFETAAKLKYEDKNLKPEQNENANKYLDALLAEYTEKIQKGDHPRAKAGSDH